MKFALAAVLALLAAPSFAETDAATMTCKDLMAMDSGGMMTAGKSIHTSMMADKAMASNTKMTAMTDEDTMKAAETACKAEPDGTVMNAMNMADPSMMSCKDLMAMDETGMMGAGKSIHTSMMADAKMGKMSDDETMKAAETACKAHPDGMVMDAMKM